MSFLAQKKTKIESHVWQVGYSGKNVLPPIKQAFLQRSQEFEGSPQWRVLRFTTTSEMLKALIKSLENKPLNP